MRKPGMQAFVITAQVSTFLLATPREWDYRTCYKAARGGHRDLLVWAMNNGAFTTDACNGAARGGHFELVRFLNVECGLRIDGWTVFKAAKAGHFDMVKWMVNTPRWSAGCASTGTKTWTPAFRAQCKSRWVMETCKRCEFFWSVAK